jgi:chemotaxis protein methyltransferase WspC
MTQAPSLLKKIEERLNRVIGLDVHSLGSSLIALAVRTRMKKRGIVPIADYVTLLEESAGEWQALVEEIVVPETWFFRDRQPFIALGEWASREWLPQHPYNVLRILSSPCSTGEEPFSIVMALMDAGLEPERFAVEAIDISEVALAKARQGLYGRNSFRGPVQDYREKYFSKTEGGWQLADSVRRHVQFRQINVFDPAFARKESHFDVIFCRNMMIYFDAASRSRLMKQLGEMLSPEGRLFLGHAEGGIARSFGFEPLPLAMAFAFRKIQASEVARVRPSPKPRSVVAIPPKKNSPAAPPVLSVLPFRPKAQKEAVVVPVPLESLLEQARHLADAGCLDAARTQCEAALQLQGCSAPAYYLLGLICDAAGKPDEAEAFYRKTLYLEPDHYEALSQLALLAEKSGDSKAADQLRQRAKRSQSKAAARSNAS